MKLKPLDGTVCYWTGCNEPTETPGLCATHELACKCRGQAHFIGEGCDSDLNADGICATCVEECGTPPGGSRP